ncbi:MAG: sigma-70 family RNA polymerase sigma factor [Labilithrix sp.]|nr:sigma-70 family RNA polymerase sigma factor [Labilithrix sp.]
MMKAEHPVGLSPSAVAAADDPSTPAPRTEASTAQRLRTVVDAEHGFVWRTLRRLGVREADVEDAVQEVFLALHRRADDVEVGSERGFLFRACEFVAMRARRTLARRRESTDVEPAAPEAPREDSPDHALGRAQTLERLDRVLDRLDDDLRSVFVLYEIEELTMNEIAHLLAIPLGTVASRLRRARKSFLTHARRDEEEHG